MHRLFFGILGFAFLLVSSLLITGLLWVVFFTENENKLIALFGIPFSTLFFLIGLVTLWKFAFNISWNDNCLSLQYVFWEKKVEWDKVIWYKYLYYKGTFTGGANIWTLLKFKRVKGEEITSKTVILLIPNIGPKLYHTILDKYVS